VVAAIGSYLDAIADHDAVKACREMTAEAKREALSIGPKSVGSTCRSVVGSVAKLITEPEAKQLREAKVDHVRIEGETATASIVGAATTVRLSKSNGRWEIAGGFDG
jgi:hypothetical protein